MAEILQEGKMRIGKREKGRNNEKKRRNGGCACACACVRECVFKQHGVEVMET